MANDIRDRFGERVRELRQAAGIAQEELAARAKLSRHYVSEMESGKRNPSIEVVEKIASGLRVPIREIMDL